MSIEHTTTLQRHSVWAPVGLTALDRIITVPNFAYESNPIVTALGPFNWILLTVGLLTALLCVWYMTEVYRSSIAQACVILLSSLMFAVCVSNVYVILMA